MNLTLFVRLCICYSFLLVGCTPREQSAEPEAVEASTEEASVAAVAVAEGPKTAATEPAKPEPAALRTFYYAPTGAGEKNGSDWENAIAAADLPAFLKEQILPGDKVLLGSGKFPQLSLPRGGNEQHAVTIEGVDTGEGLPRIEGKWKETNPKYHAHSWGGLTVGKGAAYVNIRGFQISGFIYGVQAKETHHVTFADMSISRVREGFKFTNLTDSQVRDSQITPYGKRGIRFDKGCHDLLISHVLADATGGNEAWPTEAFPFGFSVESDDGNHSIRYEYCTAANNVYRGEKGKYWNGDGFIAETPAKNLSYFRCKSFHNTDGGWDDKSLAPELVDCIAANNKRGFRFWNSRGDVDHPAKLVNCLGVNNKSLGGSGSSAGLWACGAVEARNCTFHNNATAAVNLENNHSGGKLVAIDCILSAEEGVGSDSLVLKEGGTKYEAQGVVQWKADDPENDPQYVAPSPDWRGTPANAYNSRKYGKSKGFWLEPAS